MVCHGYGQLARYFLRHFEPLVRPGTLVVAPEALSRFYTDGLTGRVGASWMTKDARLEEIQDYVHYLSRLYAWIKSSVGHERFRLHVLGFSQGAATACRWVAEKNIAASSLICWAGFFPPDLNWTSSTWQRPGFRTYVVYGNNDQLVTPEAMQSFRQAIHTLELKPTELTFEGGHEMHAPTLAALANELRNM